ncbi:MAG: PKD domain-containing protein [Bacteroidetes bacterium]|nr:PKD domain-containing protein [Bacteroidota bacterium]
MFRQALPDKTSGCPPLLVDFADSSSDNTTDWLWDFGNGNTSLLQSPSALFLEPGDYLVKLTVKNDLGETDSTTRNIRVFRTPKVDFYVNKPIACTYDTIFFYHDITLGDAPITDYGWGYGNGLATIIPNPSLKYPVGSYDITLVVKDSNGCSASLIKPGYVNVFKPPVAKFTAYPTKTCNPSLTVNFSNSSTGNGLSYYWDFDGVNSSTVKNPPAYTYHQQKYSANLTVTDSNGCRSKNSVVVQATSMTANFKPSKYIVCTGENITFTNTSNFLGTEWFWDFGDSTTSTSKTPSHAYENPGIYDVSLRIADGECKDSIMYLALLTITPGAKINGMGISADVSQSCTPPLKVNFTNKTPMDGVIGLQWNFGDGNTSTELDPTHTYTSSGSFTVTLTVMDSGGCITKMSFPNYISTSGPGVNFNTPTGCFGTPYTIRNSSAGATSYLWTFYDGTTSTTTNPQITFPNPGSYNVTLRGRSSLGCEKSITKTIKIDTVNVDFNVDATFSPCPPFVATFKNTSKTSGLTYSWEFGDGVKDSKLNPTHIYYYPGKYSVKLTGTNKNGCKDVANYPDLIEVQGPTAQFNVSPKLGCLPLQVNISAEPSSNTKKFWCDLGDGNVIEDSLSINHTYSEARTFYPKFVLIDHVGCSVSYPLDSIKTYASPTLEVKDTSVCRGDYPTISLKSDGTRFKWTPSQFLDCDTCKNVLVSSNDTISYQIVATNKGGCETKASIKVNVEPIPNLVSTGPISLCANDEYQLFVGNAPRIVWSPAIYLDDSSSLNPLCKPQQSVDYTVTGYNLLGCSATAIVPITVKSKVDISLPQDFAVCPFDTTQIETMMNFGSVLGVHYQWSPPYYVDDAQTANPFAVMKNRPITFQLIASGGECEADTEIVTINIRALPVLEVSNDITTTPNSEIQLLATSSKKVSYQWQAPEELSCTDCRRPVIRPTLSQTVQIEVTDEYGCKTQDSIRIRITGCDENTVFVPNTFTPNGDGRNDVFRIRSLSLTSLDYFRIFDKWGGVVFETTELDKGWDGLAPNKQFESTGVYVYMFQGKCENGNTISKSGNVTAVR